MAFADPRSCLREFLQTGRNLGKRSPSFSLRDVSRDIRNISTKFNNIGDRIEGAIGAASRGEFLPGQVLSVTNEFRCPPTQYANYFSQHRQPKFKFMFFVSVELNPDFVNAFGGKWSDGEMWWFIKQSSRPGVTYEYEDVNMYNFRQKILRRATFEPIQMQMYDDLYDVSHSFWTTYLRIQSPVTGHISDLSLGDTTDYLEESGMSWLDPKISTATGSTLEQIRSNRGERSRRTTVLRNSASTAVLPGGNQHKQIIKSIKIYHVIDWGRKMVVYNYVNPRINEVKLDELTWESSDPNVIDVTFDFDTFQMLFPNDVTEDVINNNLPPIYPINLNTTETPFGVSSKGLDKIQDLKDSTTKTLTNVAANAQDSFNNNTGLDIGFFERPGNVDVGSSNL